MAIKNQSIVVTYFAWDTGNQVGKTGDAANHTMYVSIDGVANAVDDTSSAEVDATNLQGHYQVTLTAAEMNGNHIMVGGESSTEDIVIVPISITTERGNLQTVDDNVDSVKAKTDNLPADPASETNVNANETKIDALNNLSAAEVNAEVDTALTGYDAPTKAEMDTAHALLTTPAQVATALTNYDSPTKAELDSGLAGLNDLSAAEVNAEADAALSDYDPPTKTEMDTAHGLLATEAKQDVIDTVVDAILADTNELQTDDIPAAIAALNNLSADDVWDEVMESTLTGRQVMRIFLAVLAGITTGGGSASLAFRDVADGKDRVAATVDSEGNRDAIVLDGS